MVTDITDTDHMIRIYSTFYPCVFFQQAATSRDDPPETPQSLGTAYKYAHFNHILIIIINEC